MRSSRRSFLKTAAASASIAALPRVRIASAGSFADEVLREKLANDPLRPQFHLLPAKNWMNDPNGPIFWNGLYHMFFQYNPNAAVWGDMHWNHAVSEDMIHWRHLPIALAPTPGWADAGGCFTGSAINDNGIATILYTGVQETAFERATLRDGHHNFRETQCLATSSDPQLRAWNKWKDPVIQPPEDPGLTGFRDPFLWQDEKTKTWLLGVASGQCKVGGRVLLYRSKDLRNWEYLHPFASGHWTEKENTNPVDSGEMWECPDFFPLGKKHVLLYSTAGQVIWETGELDPKELVFHPQKRGVLDHGAYYAQKTQLDANGNRILWGWIPEKRPDSELVAAGWAGCMALPRVLSLGLDDTLEMSFLHELRKLFKDPFEVSSSVLHLQSQAMTNAIQRMKLKNLAAQIGWRSNGNAFSLKLIDDAGPWLTVTLESARGAITGLSVNGVTASASALQRPVFQLFLDGSVAELICDARHAFTTRVYRKPEGPLRISLGLADSRSLDYLSGSQIQPISNDRLTS
ncbi:MAG TPA: glycoside hydrolase family 32 protein [Candidatus Acidoferrum sp.]|nr:glycoside hydrolase family 32 protein [Candidatus Acidoferrum sp.]